MNWSKRELLETSVDSYICMAMPQNMEKLYSICEYSSVFTGRPVNTDEYSQMEYNFSMFWGMAIQMYESTLVSNNSRFDQFMDGNRGALTAQEQRGLDRFQGKGHCTSCHNGGEITDATVSNVLAHGGSVVEVLPGGRWHDIGFHNIGVRPVNDEIGR